MSAPLVYCNVRPRPHPVAVIQGRCVSCGQPVKAAT